MPTLLFVTYGGGHARMLIPVIQALQQHPALNIQVLALTTAAAMFKDHGIACHGFLDFVTADDTQALAIGERLAATHHRDESGIAKEESIAYLGLSYHDMVQRLGEQRAREQFEREGRQAFIPISVMERVLDRIRPDLVVVTNSPRSERAVVEVARRRSIPSIALVDLFGMLHFHVLEADYLFVMSEKVIDNLEREGVRVPRQNYRLIGNPAFDAAYDYRGNRDTEWLRMHLPQLPNGMKTLLWVDMPAYWHVPSLTLHQRSEEEVIRDLEEWAAACISCDAALLIRPHPSQPRAPYDRWLKNRSIPHAYYAGNLPLYPLLSAVDAVSTYTSTVGLEAVLMEKPLIQLQYYEGPCDMPLAAWGLAWQVSSASGMAAALKGALYDTTAIRSHQATARKLLPQEKAAPAAARAIIEILSRHTGNKLLEN